jgi:DNA invertase Pin-like site-specific DNA recombinase
MSPAHRGKFVSYLRVSTDRQGADGLGIAAQRSAVATYLNGGAWTMLKEFVEVESGKVNARPQLEKALNLCKVSRARLVIAKLDRLSRNAAFLLKLRDTGVRFVAADMPEATDTVIGIMAVIAQDERERISQRTKDGLAEAKKRGVKLGNPHGAAPLRRAGKGNRAAVATLRAQADARAKDLAPILDDIMKTVTSHRDIATELNEREIPSPRGKQWGEIQVARLRRRLGRLAERRT